MPPGSIAEDARLTASSVVAGTPNRRACCGAALGVKRECRLLEDRRSDRDLAAETKHDHFPVGILCAQNKQFGSEARDVLRAEVADANDNQMCAEDHPRIVAPVLKE